MTNQELENKIKELLAYENMFDMIMAAQTFNKEYKTSDFYKATKMSLMDVLKASKFWYGFQFNDIITKIQQAINNLDLSHLNDLFQQIGDVFSKENDEMMDILTTFKSIVK